MRLHAKDDHENAARVIEALKTSIERLHPGKYRDNFKITSKEFIQILTENKQLCDLISPFNIDQTHSRLK